MTLFEDELIPADAGSTDADSFQTPPIALLPLYPYLPCDGRLWEPCAGEGNLVQALCRRGYNVIGSDILTGQDFLTCRVPNSITAIVTNPPYSLQDKFLKRAYEIGAPFAFLLPVACIGGQTRQKMYREHGIEIVMLGRRINFKTPTGKEDGRGSSATFETAWFCSGLNIGSPLTFFDLPRFEEATA